MDEKLCSTCGENQSLSYDTRCSFCKRTYDNNYYKRNKNRRVQIRRSNRKISARNRAFILKYKEENPCVDCGESDPVVLDFDHVRGEKENEVARLVINQATIERIKKEIEKCDIRCANCHRRRHARIV